MSDTGDTYVTILHLDGHCVWLPFSSVEPTGFCLILAKGYASYMNELCGDNTIPT
jgi:hypothetical protein